MYTWLHICQGNYSVSEEFDDGDQIGHRYFDLREYPADLIAGIRCDAIMAEYDYVDAYEGLLRGQQLAVGAADVQDRTVEAAEMIMERVASHRWLPAEQTLITSSCGMNHLPREVAYGMARLGV